MLSVVRDALQSPISVLHTSRLFRACLSSLRHCLHFRHCAHMNGSHPFTLACSFSPLIPSDASGPTYPTVQASNFFHLSASQYYPCRVCVFLDPLSLWLLIFPLLLHISDPLPTPLPQAYPQELHLFSRCLVPMSRALGTALPGNKTFPLLRISQKVFSSLDL